MKVQLKCSATLNLLKVSLFSLSLSLSLSASLLFSSQTKLKVKLFFKALRQTRLPSSFNKVSMSTERNTSATVNLWSRLPFGAASESFPVSFLPIGTKHCWKWWRTMIWKLCDGFTSNNNYQWLHCAAGYSIILSESFFIIERLVRRDDRYQPF